MFYIRPSQLLSYDICPRQYYYKYVIGYVPEITSVNLPFGTAVHEASTGYVAASLKRVDFDPVKVFRNHFSNSLGTLALNFGANVTDQSLLETGSVLVSQFADQWDQSDYLPLVDDFGEPVVEKRYQVQIAPGIVLSGQPDIVALHKDTFSTCAIDIKTTLVEYSDHFLLASEQLTDYQIILDAYADTLNLGSEGLSEVGFIELFKRKVSTSTIAIGPSVSKPKTAPRRSDFLISERIQKIINSVNDIQNGRFEKRPLMSFNSPCNMCEFKDLCLKNDDSGLIIKSK